MLISFIIFHVTRYDGDFQNDMKGGHGVLQYINGEKYEVHYTTQDKTRQDLSIHNVIVACLDSGS